MVEQTVEKVAQKLRSAGFTVQTAYSEDGKNYEMRVSRAGRSKVKAFAPDASDLEVASTTVALVGEFQQEELASLFPPAETAPAVPTTPTPAVPVTP
jgi:hypothetical protein